MESQVTCLYLHIPFCLRKCDYCSFTSEVAPAELQKRYLQALRVQLEIVANESDKSLSSLFLGGGTPTCLEQGELCSLITFCKTLFGFSADSEITVEANPGTVDGHYFEMLLESGVNRLSLGVQSFCDSELQVIGRLHNRKEAIEAARSAKSAGFTNINLDLMYGLPEQTVGSWSESLDQAFDLKVQHLSLYQLMLEEGTRLGRLDQAGGLSLPEEEQIIEMDSKTIQSCREQGFLQYETSNFSLPGFECRHNINYWENNEYLAAGAAAVSYQDGKRQRRVGDLEKYIAAIMAGRSAIVESEELDRESSFRETVIMGLRMKRGVSLAGLQNRYNLSPQIYYGQVLDKLLGGGLVELTPTHLRITEQGWPLSNRIMAELV